MKQKDIPCQAEPMLLCGTLMHSFIDTPWPNALGQWNAKHLWTGHGREQETGNAVRGL